MSRKLKLMSLCYLLLLLLQLLCAISNKSPWPLMAYNFFATEPTKTRIHYRFIVEYTDGHELIVEPGRVVPIEFFKATDYINRSLLARDNEYEKKDFLSQLFHSAYQSPWYEFDEVWPSIRDVKPNQEVNIIHYVMDIYDHDTINKEYYLKQRNILYSFKPI